MLDQNCVKLMKAQNVVLKKFVNWKHGFHLKSASNKTIF
jgi:hypothetical protein